MEQNANKYNVDSIWNDFFTKIKLENANLSCYFIFSYKDVWDDLEPEISAFILDERREWDNIKIVGTNEENTYVMKFLSEKRSPALFLIHKTKELDDVYIFRAYTLESQNRKSTIESFVNSTNGMWFPRLRFSFMDDLSGVLKELFPSGKVDMNEFVINVFEKTTSDDLSRQKTSRTWVEQEGDREYDILKKANLALGRIVTLTAARFVIEFGRGDEKLDFRIDHKSRFLLSTAELDRFETVLDYIEKELTGEFTKFRINQRAEKKSITGYAGRKIVFVDYAGTNYLTINVPQEEVNWFGILSTLVQDNDYLHKNEKILSFVISDERNPLLQIQLVDMEGQSTTNMTLEKDENKIRLAPESFEANVDSIAKILNFLEKTLGTAIRIV